MNEEKIVYTLDIKNLFPEPLVFLFYTEQSAVISMIAIATSLTLAQNPNIFFLQLMLFSKNKVLSKNNFEVNL